MLRLVIPTRAVQNIFTSTLARGGSNFIVKRSKYTLPDLPYDYNVNTFFSLKFFLYTISEIYPIWMKIKKIFLIFSFQALEPTISAEIMQIHHTKHHQAYVNGLNQAEEKLQEAFKENDVTAQIALQSALKFNGGGKD